MAEAAEAVEEGKVNVKKAQLTKAIKALSQWIAKKSANSNALFGSATETMHVLFTLSTIPDAGSKNKSVLIPLPHPLYDDSSEICFICKDPHKPMKELLLQKKKVPGLTKVIGVGKVRRNYNTVEEKKALADAFDLFIADKTICDQLPSTLGRIFYKQKLKIPVTVPTKEDPSAHIRKAINGTPLRFPGGICVGVKFGRSAMSEEQLLANASAVIGHVAKHLARLGNPVQAINVQATDAPALPVWRRPLPPGELLDLKKYRSDASSSSASGSGGASETEATGLSEVASDTLETISNRDSISEAPTEMEEL